MSAFIVFSGLPGCGKTTLSRELAKQLGSVYLRIDSIEAGLKGSYLEEEDLKDAGYQAAYAVARDNLKAGLTVIADSVNPIQFCRDGYHKVGKDLDIPVVDIEVTCSNKDEHKRRVEEREPDLLHQTVPTWEKVQNREYEPWKTEILSVDTYEKSPEDCLSEIRSYLSGCNLI